MTVYRRGKTWVGTFQHRGERVWIGSHKTRKEATCAENELRREREGLSPETFEGWARRWLRDYARPAPTTREGHRLAVRNLLSEFGPRKLGSIDRMEARSLAHRLPQGQIKCLRSMFNDAIDAGLVRENPFARLRLEQPRGRKDLEALTEEEVVALAFSALGAYDDAYGLVMKAWVLVAGFTGIRPGESYVLEWDDIKGDEMVVQGTKTKTARRRIVIPPVALSGLREMPRWFDSPYVFVSPRGHQFTKNILTRHFDKVRRSYGRVKLVPYALRHAFATNLMRRGIEPWVIARLMGHDDHGKRVVTLYGHPTEMDAIARVRAAYGQNVVELAAHSQQASSEGG